MSKSRVFEKTNTIITIIATIIAGVALYFQFYHEKIKLQAVIYSTTKLVPLVNIDKLEAKYKYLGQDVNYLWEMKVRFINNGDKTIISEGTAKNILRDNISFKFLDNLRILNVEQIKSDFSVDVLKLDNSSFALSFDQWRAGETASFSFYLSSDSDFNPEITFRALRRDLIDGDIIVEKSIGLDEERAILKYIPKPIIVAVKTMMLFSFGLFSLIFVIMPFRAFIEYYKYKKWKSVNFDEYSAFVDTLDNLSVSSRDKFKQLPHKLPKELWENFHGEKLTESPITASLQETFAFAMTMLFLAGISTIATFLIYNII